MSKKNIATTQAPAAIGPYSQGIVTGNLLFSSGQLPLNPETGNLSEGSIEEQAHVALKNVKAIAEAAGTNMDKAVKVTVFLADIADFQAVNSVYAEYFSEPFPARSAFQVTALPLGASLEIEAVFEV